MWALTIDGIDCSCSPRWCTPTATDRKGKSGPNAKALLRGGYARLSDQIGGVPHPEFVEELMGFPNGWTELGQSETRQYRQWLQRFCPFSVAEYNTNNLLEE
ncbi:MAG: hypothetical protein AMXMBFR16_11130 [Candidatus Uhrbacteria bacterium]